MLAAVLIFGALTAPVVPHHAAPVVRHPTHNTTVHHAKKPHTRHRHHSPAYFALAHEKHVLHLEHLRQVFFREQAAQYVPKEPTWTPGSQSASSPVSSPSSSSGSSTPSSSGGSNSWTPVHHHRSYRSYSSWTPASTPSYGQSSHSSSAGSSSISHSGYGNGGSSVTDIPGVPKSFVACVAQRESGNGKYAAYNGGTYGIIRASGYNVNGQSLSAQKQAFSKIYATTGPSAWSASDGC